MILRKSTLPPFLQQSKKGTEAPSEDRGAGPSSDLPTANNVITDAHHPPADASGSSDALAAASSPHGSVVGPSIGPSGNTQLPAIIRPVILRPVVAAAAGNAPLPTAPPPRVPTVVNTADAAGSHMAASEPAALAAPLAPALDMASALAAVQRARRMVDEARKGKQKPEECIVCFVKLSGANAAVRLAPCGHRQMCSQCCKDLLAIAESKEEGGEFLVSRRRACVCVLALSPSAFRSHLPFAMLLQCPTCRLPVEEVAWP